MNLVINTNKFFIDNINLLKQKTNIIVDGNFTKLIYSNEYFIMNGIFLNFPLEILSVNTEPKYNTIFYQPYEKKNYNIIQQLINIESELLDYYKKSNNINKKNVNVLSKKIFTGNFKIYKDEKNKIDISNNFIIKISGIWETYSEIGLAIKVINGISIS
jgi:hypothetical protein